MPEKRKRKSNGLPVKQKRLITSRLMAISLQVDNYVYKNKEISEDDAKKYLHEVSSYKIPCCKDERCLQVIEKLTRIMKAIIAEHQEAISNVQNENNTFLENNLIHGPISPEYSLPDEDRTHFTDIITEENVVYDIMSNIDNFDDIIDLCDDDETVTLEHPHSIPAFNIDVEMNRAISNLSITSDDQMQTTSVDVECSQSILNNFDNIGANNEDVNDDSKIAAQNLKKIITNYFVRESPTNMNICKLNENKIANTNCIKQTDTMNTSVKDTIHNPINNDSRNYHTIIKHNSLTAGTDARDEFNHTNNIQNSNVNKSSIMETYVSSSKCLENNFNPQDISKKTQSSGKHFNDDNSVIHNSSSVETKATENPLIHQVTKGVDSKYIITTAKPQSVDIAATNHVTNKSKKRPRKKNSQGTENKSNKKSKKRNEPKNVGKNKAVVKKLQIYNKNTDNDISWMENIRFVREIRADEFDSHLNFEDSFWDNYSLPGIWDDRDFDI